MANELNINFGAPGTGLNIYVVIFSADSTKVWNGSAWVTDSTSARNAGAVSLTETVAGSGNYYANLPPAILIPNYYPIIGYIRLGGSPSVATDTVVTFPSSVVYAPSGLIPGTVMNPTALADAWLPPSGLKRKSALYGSIIANEAGFCVVNFTFDATTDLTTMQFNFYLSQSKAGNATADLTLTWNGGVYATANVNTIQVQIPIATISAISSGFYYSLFRVDNGLEILVAQGQLSVMPAAIPG